MIILAAEVAGEIDSDREDRSVSVADLSGESVAIGREVTRRAERAGGRRTPWDRRVG